MSSPGLFLLDFGREFLCPTFKMLLYTVEKKWLLATTLDLSDGETEED